jgi:hypothetical protein
MTPPTSAYTMTSNRRLGLLFPPGLSACSLMPSFYRRDIKAIANPRIAPPLIHTSGCAQGPSGVGSEKKSPMLSQNPTKAPTIIQTVIHKKRGFFVASSLMPTF